MRIYKGNYLFIDKKAKRSFPLRLIVNRITNCYFGTYT